MDRPNHDTNQNAVNVLIAGAGASGMMAAIFAARNGAQVTVLEQFHKVGQKILASGNGRCNFTNRMITDASYRGESPDFVTNVLAACSPEDLITFFRQIGVPSVEHNGWVYPHTEESATIVNALLRHMDELPIKVKTKERITGILQTPDGFEVRTKSWQYSADRVVLCTGSHASAVKSASEDGYRLAEELGHASTALVPALTYLKSDAPITALWQNVRIRGTVHLHYDGRIRYSDSGQIQLIRNGISGIPVFQISRFSNRALLDQKTVYLTLDMLPEMEEDALSDYLETIHDSHPGYTLKQLLEGILPQQLAAAIATLCRDTEQAVSFIKRCLIPVTGSGSIKEAQVCAGGIRTAQIDPVTLESRIVPGLYFAGELIDVDGDCGGYNLHWAFASGRAAGIAAATT